MFTERSEEIRKIAAKGRRYLTEEKDQIGGVGLERSISKAFELKLAKKRGTQQQTKHCKKGMLHNTNTPQSILSVSDADSPNDSNISTQARQGNSSIQNNGGKTGINGETRDSSSNSKSNDSIAIKNSNDSETQNRINTSKDNSSKELKKGPKIPLIPKLADKIDSDFERNSSFASSIAAPASEAMNIGKSSTDCNDKVGNGGMNGIDLYSRSQSITKSNDMQMDSGMDNDAMNGMENNNNNNNNNTNNITNTNTNSNNNDNNNNNNNETDIEMEDEDVDIAMNQSENNNNNASQTSNEHAMPLKGSDANEQESNDNNGNLSNTSNPRISDFDGNNAIESTNTNTNENESKFAGMNNIDNADTEGKAAAEVEAEAEMKRKCAKFAYKSMVSIIKHLRGDILEELIDLGFCDIVDRVERWKLKQVWIEVEFILKPLFLSLHTVFFLGIRF